MVCRVRTPTNHVAESLQTVHGDFSLVLARFLNVGDTFSVLIAEQVPDE